MLQWTDFTRLSGTSRREPALAWYGDRFVMAIRSNDNGGDLYTRLGVPTANHQIEWAPRWTEIPGSTLRQPALAVHDGRLWMGIRSNDARRYLYINSTTDPLRWGSWRRIPSGTSMCGPGLASHAGRLFMAVADADTGWGKAPEDPDVERTVYVASTTDGIQWTPWQELHSTDGARPKTTDGPAIVSFAGKLVMACRSDKSGHIRASWSEDGATWAPFQTVAGSTAGRPTLCVFGDELYMGVRSNSNLILEGWLGGPGFETASHELYYSRSIDGMSWERFTQLPSGSSEFGPALAANDSMLVMGVRGRTDSSLYWARALRG